MENNLKKKKNNLILVVDNKIQALFLLYDMKTAVLISLGF